MTNLERLIVLASRMQLFWTIEYVPPHGHPPSGEQYQVSIQGKLAWGDATTLDAAIELALMAWAEKREC